MLCRPEVGLLQYGVAECGVQQVAVCKEGGRKICIREICFANLTVREYCFLNLQAKEGSVVQRATLKGKGEVEGVTFVEPEAQQFTILEFHTTESGAFNRCEAHITAGEHAVDKYCVDKAASRKVAVLKSTLLIFHGRQRSAAKVLPVKRPVGVIILFHTAENYSISAA